jgi:hypothetical protein
MAKLANKPSMKRFEPTSGWSDADASIVLIDEFPKVDNKTPVTTENISADALANLGDSIQDVFNSLKISDPRLGSWVDVDLAIRDVGAKIKERRMLENRLQELKLEIASASELAASLVSSAYQQEIEVHATAKLRVEIAELLNQKLAHALKT